MILSGLLQIIYIYIVFEYCDVFVDNVGVYIYFFLDWMISKLTN